MNKVSYIFPPKPMPVIAVAGSESLFPVNRIFCIGRNYQAHAKEMGMSVDKSSGEPFFFLKDATTIVASGSVIDYPLSTSNYHYEIELAIAIDRDCYNIAPSDVESFIYGYAVSLDMTRRDLQNKAKQAGLPWDFAKNFEQAAVFAPIVPKAELTKDIISGEISLTVNGELRQQAKLIDLIWSIPELVSYLSKFYHLKAGDIILTGTPEGVGAVKSGDVIRGKINQLVDIELTIS